MAREAQELLACCQLKVGSWVADAAHALLCENPSNRQIETSKAKHRINARKMVFNQC